MKKAIVIMLALTLLLGVLPTQAYANSVDNLEAHSTVCNQQSEQSEKAGIDYPDLTCPRCGNLGTITGYFTEYTYYCTYIWAEMLCGACDYEWNIIHTKLVNAKKVDEYLLN